MKPAVFVDISKPSVRPTIAPIANLFAETTLAKLRAKGFAIVALNTDSTLNAAPADPETRTVQTRDETQIVDEAKGLDFDAVYGLSPGSDDESESAAAALGRASQEHEIDLAKSWMIGTSADGVLAAADEVGGGGVLVVQRTGDGHAPNADGADFVARDFEGAVAWIIDQIDWPDSLDWIPRPESGQPGPFFIVGAERSGTTLFRLILMTHPEIACHSEFEYVVDWLDPSTGDVQLDEFRNQLAGHRKFPTLFEVREELTIKPQIEVSQREIARAFLEQHRREEGKQVIGATVHRHFDRVLHIWPNARFIHIYRDPRDVSRSAVKMGWAGSPYHGIAGWLHSEKLWDHLREKLTPDRWTDIQYEQLVASPEQELTRICEFLEVEYDDVMLDYHKGTTYDVLDPAMTYQWRKRMSEKDLRLVETMLGERLGQLGYEHSGLPPLHPSAFQKRMLAIQNRIRKWRWGVKRYGLGLMLKHGLAKRLGMERSRARARRAMQDIDHQNLK